MSDTCGCRSVNGALYTCRQHGPMFKGASGGDFNYTRYLPTQGWVCPTCGRVMSPSMATCVQDHSAQPVPKTGANQ